MNHAKTTKKIIKPEKIKMARTIDQMTKYLRKRMATLSDSELQILSEAIQDKNSIINKRQITMVEDNEAIIESWIALVKQLNS